MAYKKIMVNGVFANLPAQTPRSFARLIMHASGIEIYAVPVGMRFSTPSSAHAARSTKTWRALRRKSGANDNDICREQR